jgi:hypothetical protein
VGTLPCITNRTKIFQYAQKECCLQVFMSGFEIRDFGLFVKQSRLKHFQHGRKRGNITKYGVASTCFMALYN